MARFWWHLMALMRAAVLLVQLDDKSTACITMVQPGRSKTLVGATYNFCGVHFFSNYQHIYESCTASCGAKIKHSEAVVLAKNNTNEGIKFVPVDYRQTL